MDGTLRSKRGRPREYGLQPLDGFADEGLALAASALDELRARVIDQIEDLPAEALRFAPEGTTLTIGALAAHLVWAELGWIERITAGVAPRDLRAAVDPAGRGVLAGTGVVPELNATELVSLCRRTWEQFTVPELRALPAGDAVIADGDRPITPRAVLMHLIWHWTYHSAHIGLIREQWGSGYEWRFGSLT